MPSQLDFNPMRAFGQNGNPSGGALAYFYETGTTTPLTVYTDASLSTAHPSPLVANANGVFAACFTDGATAVKVNVTTSGGTTLSGYPLDPIQLVSSTGSAASAVSFAPISGNGATNVQQAIQNLTTLWNAVTSYGRSLIATDSASGARAALGLGTAATKDTGTADGNVVVLDATGLPAVDASQLTGTAPAMEETAEQTITALSLLTLAHGNGSAPGEFYLYAVCKTTDSPFAVGDVIKVPSTAQLGGAEYGALLAADATNFKVRTGTGISVANDSGAALNLTLANWKYIIKWRP